MPFHAAASSGLDIRQQLHARLIVVVVLRCGIEVAIRLTAPAQLSAECERERRRSQQRNRFDRVIPMRRAARRQINFVESQVLEVRLCRLRGGRVHDAGYAAKHGNAADDPSREPEHLHVSR